MVKNEAHVEKNKREEYPVSKVDNSSIWKRNGRLQTNKN